MARDLAILACGGALPLRLAEAYPDALCLTLAGVPHRLGAAVREFRIEHLGAIFAALHEAGARRLVLAGALARPAMDPAAFDAEMQAAAPRLLGAMQKGDDALLGAVIALFEAQGVTVVGAHDLLPDLTVEEGLTIGPDPTATETADIERAREILRALSPLDIGQGCVVAAGQCLGIETVQGTDALLDQVARTPVALRGGARGVFVKAAKSGQDLRVDMPAIGPATIAAVAAAGLAGLYVEPGRVMILDRKETLQAIGDHGLFLRAGAL